MAYWQGRKEEIKQLEQWLNNPNIPLIGIEGIGGTGKSMLAAKIFEEIKESFPKRFWADVSYGAVFSDIAREVLTEFGFYVPEEEAKLVQALVKCLRSGQFLLIIDNLESLLTENRDWGSQFYSDFFQSWVEFGGSSKVIVTTRERPEFPRFEWLPLTGLKIEEGTALLTELGIKGNLEEFVELVGGHPLLLRLVADLLKEEFEQDPNLSRLADLGLGNLQQLLTDSQVVGTHRRENVGMVLVLDASFQRLSELQKSLFLNISVFRGAIDKGMATAVLPGSDEGEIERELRNLVKRSLLVEKLEEKRRFEFQPVVLEYAKYKAGEQRELHQRAIDYYQLHLQQPPWQTKEDIKEYLEIFYHQYQLENYDAAFKILTRCNEFLTLRGYYTIQVDLYGELIAGWDKNQKIEKDNYRVIFAILGNAYNSLGQYQQAITHHQKALKIAREIGDSRDEVSSLLGLGNTYKLLGQYQQAIEYYQESLQINREINDRSGEGLSLNNLGAIYNDLECYQEAIDILQQSLHIFREINNRSGELNVLGNLGNAYNCLGHYQQSVKYYQKSLEINKEIGERSTEGIVLNNLGNAYQLLKQYQKAIEYYQQSLEIAIQISDPNLENSCLLNLGIIYSYFGNYKQALKLLQKSLKIASKIGNVNGEAYAWLNLAVILKDLNRESDALGALHNARELYLTMRLEAKVQECNRKIDYLSQPKPPIPSRRSFWIWLRRLWGWVRGWFRR